MLPVSIYFICWLQNPVDRQYICWHIYYLEFPYSFIFLKSCKMCMYLERTCILVVNLTCHCALLKTYFLEDLTNTRTRVLFLSSEGRCSKKKQTINISLFVLHLLNLMVYYKIWDGYQMWNCSISSLHPLLVNKSSINKKPCTYSFYW